MLVLSRIITPQPNQRHMKFLDVRFATYQGTRTMPITHSFWMNEKMLGCGMSSSCGLY